MQQVEQVAKTTATASFVIALACCEQGAHANGQRRNP